MNLELDLDPELTPQHNELKWEKAGTTAATRVDPKFK